MDKYNVIGIIGEGSYGKVIKCQHNATGMVVAIKKFIETEEDSAARKVALREIRMLKKLHHPHLIQLLEVFRRKKRFHLVFEYMHFNLLEKLEEGPLSAELTRKYFYQITSGVDYLHSHNIIHRDMKPENILISDLDIAKLCDFGFARFATVCTEPFTDYVATRWYRSPELLVGYIDYGRAVDIWALGCILIEMLTSTPLFTGESDIDQLYQITRLVGGLTPNQKTLMFNISEDLTTKLTLEEDELIDKIKNRSSTDTIFNLQEKYPDIGKKALDLVASCLCIDPEERITSNEIMQHPYFTWDRFLFWFVPELQKKVNLEASRKMQVTEAPYPSIDSSTLTGMVGVRRGTKTKEEWCVELIHDSVLKDCPIFNNKRKFKIKDGQSNEQELGIASVNNENSVPSRKGEPQTDRENNADFIPKISMEYKRNMIPDSFQIRPVHGRLHFDKDHGACGVKVLQKSSCEEICLPQIRDYSKYRPPKPLPLDIKSGLPDSSFVKSIIQEHEQEQSVQREKVSENKPRKLSLLKRKKSEASESAASQPYVERKENMCLCELERAKNSDQNHLPDV